MNWHIKFYSHEVTVTADDVFSARWGAQKWLAEYLNYGAPDIESVIMEEIKVKESALTIEEQVTSITAAIHEDVIGRGGWQEEWDRFSKVIKEEILATWCDLVREVLNRE